MSPQPHPRRWAILAVLCLSLLTIVVDMTIVNVALPTLARDLHATAGDLQWIVDAYTLVFAALLLPAGTLGTLIGQRRVLTLGLAVFGATSLGAALVHSVAPLIAMRAGMGVGAALIMPATLSLLTGAFTEPVERAKAIGIWSAASGLGVAIGPTAGGVLLKYFSWGSVFLVNVPVVLLGIVGALALVPAAFPHMAPPSRPRLDVPGVVLSAAGIAALTYTLIEAPDNGWTSARTGLWALATLVLLVGFVVWQQRSRAPMLDLGIFRDPRFSAATGMVAVAFFALSGVTFLLTQIYQLILGYGTLSAGVRALPAAAALTVAAPLSTRLAARFGIRATVAAALLLVAGGVAWFATATVHSGYGHYVVASVVLSGGIGLVMSPATQSMLSTLPPHRTSMGSAVSNSTRNLGTVLGVAVLGSIATSVYNGRMSGRSLAAAAGTARAAEAFIRGADAAALVAAAVALAAVPVALLLLPRRAPVDTGRAEEVRADVAAEMSAA
jgi:EmrB/QacA subfamily drug resistance transporter